MEFQAQITLATWIIAGATVCNIFISIILSSINKKALKLNKKIMDLNYRPLICIDNLLHNRDVNYYEPLIKYKNYGQIPSTNLKCCWKIVYNNEEIINEEIDDPNYLLPKNERTLNSKVKLSHHNNEFINFYFEIYITLYYIDSYGKKYKTTDSWESHNGRLTKTSSKIE